jgi:hypothetical protein
MRNESDKNSMEGTEALNLLGARGVRQMMVGQNRILRGLANIFEKQLQKDITDGIPFDENSAILQEQADALTRLAAKHTNEIEILEKKIRKLEE